MLRQTPNRRHRLLGPASSDLESSYESRPGYHTVEVHTQAGPTQVSLHNHAVEALDQRCRLEARANFLVLFVKKLQMGPHRSYGGYLLPVNGFVPKACHQADHVAFAGTFNLTE